MILRLATSEKDSKKLLVNVIIYLHIILVIKQYIPIQSPNTSDFKIGASRPLEKQEDSEMEPFDRWTKIRRRFKCILWLEDDHDLSGLFKGHLGCFKKIRAHIDLLSICSTREAKYCTVSDNNNRHIPEKESTQVQVHVPI